MKAKGSTRRVDKPNFWKYEENVPNELKDFVFQQYLSNNTMHIYCDGSASGEIREMAIAVSILERGTVTVKQQLLFPPKNCYHKPIYAEIKALIFALRIFRKLMRVHCDQVIIYSDVANIESFLSKEITFNNNSLMKLQSELIQTYQQILKENGSRLITIKYLPLDLKRHNPFANSAHNAAKSMLRNRS
ncbi:hypothetical protein VBD025_02845 [Virgibacillus flavescens]|uniref:hypothetical protein n=1 Tax=Virgibacillus flavescens TaxID=1611422 RepID=UPI003D359087